MAKHAGDGTTIELEWRRLQRFLWVATDDLGHAGMIEQGRRYMVLDDTGRLRGRCSTLIHAQALLTALRQEHRSRDAGTAPTTLITAA